MFLVQGGQGGLDLGNSFLLEERFVRRGVFVGRFVASGFSRVVERSGRTMFPFPTHGPIQRNSVEPGVKGRISSKRIEFYKRLHKCFLGQIAGILRRADDVDQRVVEPVLIFGDQLSKRGRIACEGKLNELPVVLHACFHGLRRRQGGKSSLFRLGSGQVLPGHRPLGIILGP